jgi:hypothetical protein
MDRAFEQLRVIVQRLESNACTYCHQEQKVLEHSIYPELCPGRSEPPPIGGWPEPHKDDL